MPPIVPLLNHTFLWGHRQPLISAHPVHSLVLLSQEQVPSHHIQHLQHLRTSSDSRCSRKIASAAQHFKAKCHYFSAFRNLLKDQIKRIFHQLSHLQDLCIAYCHWNTTPLLVRLVKGVGISRHHIEQTYGTDWWTWSWSWKRVRHVVNWGLVCRFSFFGTLDFGYKLDNIFFLSLPDP